MLAESEFAMMHARGLRQPGRGGGTSRVPSRASSSRTPTATGSTSGGSGIPSAAASYLQKREDETGIPQPALHRPAAGPSNPQKKPPLPPVESIVTSKAQPPPLPPKSEAKKKADPEDLESWIEEVEGWRVAPPEPSPMTNRMDAMRRERRSHIHSLRSQLEENYALSQRRNADLRLELAAFEHTHQEFLERLADEDEDARAIEQLKGKSAITEAPTIDAAPTPPNSTPADPEQPKDPDVQAVIDAAATEVAAPPGDPPSGEGGGTPDGEAGNAEGAPLPDPASPPPAARVPDKGEEKPYGTFFRRFPASSPTRRVLRRASLAESHIGASRTRARVLEEHMKGRFPEVTQQWQEQDEMEERAIMEELAKMGCENQLGITHSKEEVEAEGSVVATVLAGGRPSPNELAGWDAPPSPPSSSGRAVEGEGEVGSKPPEHLPEDFFPDDGAESQSSSYIPDKTPEMF